MLRKTLVLRWGTLYSIHRADEELLKTLLWEMPQAGLNLLCQGTLRLTAEPHVLGGDSWFFLSSGYLRCKRQNWHPPRADLTNQSPTTLKQATIHLGPSF